MKRSYHFFILAVFAVWLLFLATLYKKPSLPIYGDMPNFTLVERSGEGVSKNDLLGNVWVVDFIFTRCAGPCPMMSAAVSRLARELPQVKFLSITSDPGYDTPPVLSKYAGEYDVDPSRWLFFTGDKSTIDTVANGLKFSRLDEPALHSTRFVLLDKKGRVRGYYSSDNAQSIAQLKRDANFLR